VRHVIAVEKDRRLARECEVRNAECGVDRLTVVAGDALCVDWHALLTPHSALHTPHCKIIGNIPYAITSPLIDKALTPPRPARIVFLVQAEVADRVAAPPGSKPYGALSVGVQAVCRVEKLFLVRAGAFTPRPKVDSALLRLTPREHPIVPPDEAAAFRAFVTACFARRRKQLRNVLIAATGHSATQVAEGLEALALDPAARPETLSPEGFARLLRWSVRL
jgi:16S rRNA (adenine1518-N6/adenine1519-N6)-dimethyltransferase